eukprot:snap_masked-scaffold_6-processed-gene-7.20-mRNA-1 protein AED:1.00 eAED:1.00 QI:0/0/0/0/1/1/2/0/78
MSKKHLPQYEFWLYNTFSFKDHVYVHCSKDSLVSFIELIVRSNQEKQNIIGNTSTVSCIQRINVNYCYKGLSIPTQVI